VCEDISKSPGAREIGGRDGLLKKEAKKTKKKRGKEKQQTREKKKYTERETTYF